MPVSDRTQHRIFYDHAGDSGPPVLLVMGFTMRGDAWRYQIDAFAERHQVAWFDHAGVGQSSPVRTRRLTMRDLVSDAVGVLDELGWDHAHVVGLSMGGMVTQNLALHHPRRVRSLTLAATHPGGVRSALPPLRGIRHFANANRGKTADERLESLGKLLLGPKFRRDRPEEARRILLDDFTRPPPLRTQLAQIHAISRHRTYHRLNELGRWPVLVVRPGCDVLIGPHHSDALCAGIPGAKLVRFDDSGHAVSRECAASFNAAVIEHIARAER